MCDDPQMVYASLNTLLRVHNGLNSYSQYEEAAEQSGSTQYSLPIAMQNRMSRFVRNIG
jgi:hypothetical protein